MRIDFVDFAKGYAIFTIILYHYLTPISTGLFSKLIMAGGSGVHLFILISGFGLTLANKIESIQQFYKRRFSKILLPYYFAVLFIFCVNRFIAIYPNDSYYAFLGHIFLFKMFDESIVGSYGEHFWFISTILQLYILFPLIVFIKQKVSLLKVMFVTFAISIIFSFLLYKLNLLGLRVFNSSCLQFLWEFTLGMYLADLYKNNKIEFWKLPWQFLLTTAFLGLFFSVFLKHYVFQNLSGFNDCFVLIGYTSIACLIFRISIFRSFFIHISLISYEVYLFHIFILLIILNLDTLNYFSIHQKLLMATLLLIPFAYIMRMVLMRVIFLFTNLTKKSFWLMH